MLKRVLLFIKSHAVVTAIITTLVIITAVATPIVVENYKLDKEVEAKLNLLVSSNFKVENNNYIVAENQNVENNQNISVSQEITSKDKPLTFRIERVEKKGEDWDSVEYKIVPSYDKDISKWTKADKEAYLDMEKEANRLILEEHNKRVANEEKKLSDAMAELAIETAWSKDYYFGNGTMWYNPRKRAYKGNYYIAYPEDTSKEYSDRFDEVSAEIFRTDIYPEILASLERQRDWVSPDADEIIDVSSTGGQPIDYNYYIAVLNELYHLSDK